MLGATISRLDREAPGRPPARAGRPPAAALATSTGPSSRDGAPRARRSGRARRRTRRGATCSRPAPQRAQVTPSAAPRVGAAGLVCGPPGGAAGPAADTGIEVSNNVCARLQRCAACVMRRGRARRARSQLSETVTAARLRFPFTYARTQECYGRAVRAHSLANGKGKFRLQFKQASAHFQFGSCRVHIHQNLLPVGQQSTCPRELGTVGRPGDTSSSKRAWARLRQLKQTASDQASKPHWLAGARAGSEQ